MQIQRMDVRRSSDNSGEQSADKSGRETMMAAIAELRRQLSPSGEVVSPAGRQKTIDVFGEPLTPAKSVAKICHDVETRGLEALLDYSRRIDNVELTAETIRVNRAELVAAHEHVQSTSDGSEFLAAIRTIRDHIVTFQRAILHRDVVVNRPGGSLRERYRPMARVGVCVPGGAAAYPSTVLMTAVPAQVAGVPEIAVMAPPTPFGAFNLDLLATCYELGIHEVYRMGGAQGVAAFAYGIADNHNNHSNRNNHTSTPLIRRVDKIVGPGNLFVALAKQQVFGAVDIDSIAGPSEVVVIVDETTRADFTAYDMFAQAEHSPGASILISWDAAALDRVIAEMTTLLPSLERAEMTRQSLCDFGAVILCDDAEAACEITNLIAPEHLHIATQRPEMFADKIHSAGAIFLGNYTPVAVGDYAAGPSHVLPTSGTARFASGLTCNDFLRSWSVIQFSQDGLREMADSIDILATKEGLTAHRESVRIRR